MKIGFIGTGVMGSRMVKQLLQHGYRVQVYNRTIEKAQSLQALGAVHCESLSELVSDSDIVCTCLSMPRDVLEVYQGSNGILKHAHQGTICIDLTSVDPGTSKSVFEQAIRKGISYLDCPVSGGPEGADNGSLTIMVGGEQPSFERAQPVLNVIGDKVEYLGPSGSGSIAKLINQYLVAVHSLAVSEAMVTGTAFGLNPEQLYNLLKVSYGDSRILRRHMEGFVLDRQFEPGGAVKYVHKDIHLANKLVNGAGMNQFTGQMAEQAFRNAMENGLSDKDMSAIIQPLEAQCKVVVKNSNETM